MFSRSDYLSAFMLVLVGLAPVFMVLIPWDFGSDMNPYRGFTRGLSLTVPLLEMMFVLFATVQGFSLFAAIRAVPELSKIGFAMLVAVIVAGIASSSKVPIFSLIGLGKITMHALFFLAVRDQINRFDANLRNRYWAAIGVGLLAYWAVWGISILVYEPAGKDWVVLVPGVPHVRSLGFFVLSGFFAGIVTAITGLARESGKQFVLGLVVCTVAMTMGIWTGSRGSLLAIACSFAVILMLDPTNRARLVYIAAVAAIFGIGASLALPKVHPNYGVERLVSSSTSPNRGTDVSSGRGEMWASTIEKIQERPITGWGVEQFAVSGPEKTLGYKQPHNMILQLLFSTGILGVIAALLIILPFLPRLNWDMTTPDRLAAWGLIIGILTFGLYDAAFYYTYPVMIFLLAVAMVLKPDVQTTATDRSN